MTHHLHPLPSTEAPQLHPLHSTEAPPERFTYPFCYEPHPLCQQAAQELQAYIAAHPELRQDADRGKMFGVLIVSPPSPQYPQSPQSPPLPLFFLAAYCGL